jgi:hypothetical protein
MPYDTPAGSKFDIGDFPALLETAKHCGDWDNFKIRRKQSSRAGKLRRIGCGDNKQGSPFAGRTITFDHADVLYTIGK